MATVSGRSKDPEAIAETVGLPESIGEESSRLLDRLERMDYQIPADARTYPALVYYAARQAGEPWTAGEIADAAGVDETAVSREFRRLVESFGTRPSEHATPGAFLQRIGEELDAEAVTVETARDLLREGGEAGLFENRTPAVVACLCLYAASTLHDDDLTQAGFEAFGVSRTSIRKGYREVLELREDAHDDGKLSAEDAPRRLRSAVSEIHSTLRFPSSVHAAAREILQEISEEEWIVGKSAGPIAAAVYWIAADENRMDLSQGEAADAAPGNVHKVTVNRRVSSVRDSRE